MPDITSQYEQTPSGEIRKKRKGGIFDFLSALGEGWDILARPGDWGKTWIEDWKRVGRGAYDVDEAVVETLFGTEAAERHRRRVAGIPETSKTLPTWHGRQYFPDRTLPQAGLEAPPYLGGLGGTTALGGMPTPRARGRGTKVRDVTKAPRDEKIVARGKTPEGQELPPMPTAEAPTERISELRGPAPKGPSFWTDLLKKMFIPGTTPTGIPWIFPTIAAAAGTPESARFLSMWMGLRTQVQEKEAAKQTVKQNAFNHVMQNLRTGLIDDLTPSQRKYYSDLDPTLLDKKMYVKDQRYFFDVGKKKWIKEEEAIAQGLDVGSLPMSSQKEQYLDWAVRVKTPIAKAEEEESIQKIKRYRTLPILRAALRARGVDPMSPEAQAAEKQYLLDGVYPGVKPYERDGFVVWVDPVSRTVMGRSVKIGESPDERRKAELKNRLLIEQELHKLRSVLKKDPANAQELYLEASRTINQTYNSRIAIVQREIVAIGNLMGDPMKMSSLGLTEVMVQSKLKELEEKLNELEEERIAVLGQLWSDMKQKGYDVWDIWKEMTAKAKAKKKDTADIEQRKEAEKIDRFSKVQGAK